MIDQVLAVGFVAAVHLEFKVSQKVNLLGTVAAGYKYLTRDSLT